MKKGGMKILWVLWGLFLVGLISFVTQQLWNWLVPALFAGPFINFWQALGLLVLSKILFSGLGGKHRHKKPFWQKDDTVNECKRRMEEKLSSMSEEEREAFKMKMWNRWCKQPGEENNEDASQQANDLR